MLANTKLRTKLVAIAVPPMLVLTIVAIYGGFVTFVRDSMSADELQGDLRIISILALVGIISSILAVFAMRDRIMAPILEVTAGAAELAENRLPVLIEGLRNPNAQIPEFAPINFDQTDELGDLAAALNKLQATAGEISAEQKNIFKRGISDLVVNLARRNQSLLDRQIESIDRLESDEEDPDRLEQLFSLDHLATRMRRNAESLLVLAGSEPARRRGGPVALADVLRVAMSEIEDYRKVQLSNMEHAEIGAQSAVDLAHLMSELIENATQFSPPDAVVEVKGGLGEGGSYVIGIIDHGIGMNDEQLHAANDLLSNPPDLGITLTRSLGFLVVGQLCKRLGVGVELVKTPGSGTTAIVVVPAELLAGGIRQSVQTDAAAAPSLLSTHAPEAEAAPVVEAPAEWSQAAPTFDEEPVLNAPPQWEQPAEPVGYEPPSVIPPANDPGMVPDGWVEPASPEQVSWQAPEEVTPHPQPAPSFEAPVYEAPSHEPPSYEPPSFEEPSYEAPSYEAPSYQAPAYEAPSYEAPAYEAPVQPEESAYQPPVYEAPEPEAAPAFEAPSFEPPAPQPAPAFETPAPIAGWDDPQPEFQAPHAEPASAPIVGWDDSAQAPGQSPALIDWAQEPEPSEAPSADYIPGWDDPPEHQPAQYQEAQYQPAQYQEAQHQPAAHQPEPHHVAPEQPVAHEPAPVQHTDPFAAAFQTPVPGQMPPVSRLDQAIPTGDQFESGVEELLQEPQERTSAGLARRDRDTSQAPVSEGRPVAASVRSPDEVRNMLARYRSGLKGNPGNGDQS